MRQLALNTIVQVSVEIVTCRTQRWLRSYSTTAIIHRCIHDHLELLVGAGAIAAIDCQHKDKNSQVRSAALQNKSGIIRIDRYREALRQEAFDKSPLERSR